MIVSRRSLLATAALAPLASCASLGIGTPTPTQLQQDVTTLADGLSSIVQGLLSLPANLQPSAAVIAQIQTEIAAIKADAAQIGAVAGPNQTLVQQISNAVGIISTLVSPFFPVAGTVAMVVQAALSFLPTILAFVGIQAALAPQKYTAEQARTILKGAAGGIAP